MIKHASKFVHLVICPLLVYVLVSCAPSLVKRDQTIATAWRYSAIEWTPTAVQRFHGKDSRGIEVHTPDHELAAYGFANGWWQVGQTARGMPYMWGGFDTPESFQRALSKGRYAGDISSPGKQELGDRGVSRSACGIDCSGLVSRCWDLPHPYSTKELPSICRKLKSWDELKPGDILLNYRHVLLFKGWNVQGEEIYAYEAGPYPVWRVNAAAMQKAKLEHNGYRPWAYRGMLD
jgi:hypothetical protein